MGQKEGFQLILANGIRKIVSWVDFFDEFVWVYPLAFSMSACQQLTFVLVFVFFQGPCRHIFRMHLLVGGL